MGAIVAFMLAASVSASLVTGPVELVSEGYVFTEGPLWRPSKEMIFSDVRAAAIYRTDGTTVRTESGGANGLANDPQGALVCTEGVSRRITRVDSSGTVTVLADKYGGKRLNSPNDCVMRSDGTLFFTDPSNRTNKENEELGFSGVFAISPDGKMTLLLKDFTFPNGIALSPDEKTLYVADTMKAHVRAFDLEGLTASNGRVFCSVRIPDGIKIDAKGYLWAASVSGIAIYDPQGNHVETVKIPKMASNCAFGGEDLKTLYVTARTSVYKMPTAHAGLPQPIK